MVVINTPWHEKGLTKVERYIRGFYPRLLLKVRSRRGRPLAVSYALSEPH